jgi:ribosomal RNA assembly protein
MSDDSDAEPEPVDTTDYWQKIPWEKGSMKHGLTEESSFATLFPRYREKYLQVKKDASRLASLALSKASRSLPMCAPSPTLPNPWPAQPLACCCPPCGPRSQENWMHITKAFRTHGLDCALDLQEGSMTVKTTAKTWDPYIVMKARDTIKCLARSVPYDQAVRALEDDIYVDVIKIGGSVQNKARFVKRRERLVGPNGSTLKAIELLSGCYVLVQGNTVTGMGPFRGINQVRKIVTDCMRNIHPIYNIKDMMLKRELAKDEKLKDESWDRFLPKFKKNNKSAKAKKKPSGEAGSAAGEKKGYTTFAPPQAQRKGDMAMQTGEFFALSGSAKGKGKDGEPVKRKGGAKGEAKKASKLMEGAKPAKKSSLDPEVAALAQKLKKHSSQAAAKQDAAAPSASAFLMPTADQKRKREQEDTGSKKKKK